MIIDGTEYFPVTEDTGKLARLRRRWGEGASSRELAEFAASLGLTPPGHDPGDELPKIVEVWPPDTDDGLLVWDLHEMEEADPEEYEQYPQGESPWR